MVYLNFVCFGVKLSCILRSFDLWNSRIQTFECVGFLILHDLDLRLNERLSVDFWTPIPYCIKWVRNFFCQRERL